VDRNELAWAAGFFDGEGWFGLAQEKGRRTGQPHARVNQADARGVPEVLARLRSAVGFGHITGPYQKDGRIDLYGWEISSRGHVELLHHLLLPWLGQVKLAEFGAALGRDAARSRTVSRTDEWIAWCAGLFDGEGWASMWPHRTHVGYLSAEVGVGQSSPNGRPEVLRRFQQVVGCGRIYGPYVQAGATMDVYKFKASALADIRIVIESIKPMLSSAKRDDVLLVQEILDGQPELPRGNPAWGNRKTHCINGHEYAKGRIRPYASRSKNVEPRDSEQCLQCAREQARAHRAKRKSSADDGGRSISEFASSYLLK
jgi:hypothetical protein